MKIPNNIDFSELVSTVTFGSTTSEYKALVNLDDESEWKGYQNEMLRSGVSVRYDAASDVFVAHPVKLRALKESDDLLLDDEDIDIETNEFSMDMEVGDPNFSYPRPPIEKNNNQMQVVSLDDVLNIIKQIMPAGTTQTQTDPLATPGNGALQAGDDAMKKTYFQGDGNEVLDSEFDINDENINHVEGIVSGEEKYVNTINGTSKTAPDFDTISSDVRAAVQELIPGDERSFQEPVKAATAEELPSVAGLTKKSNGFSSQAKYNDPMATEPSTVTSASSTEEEGPVNDPNNLSAYKDVSGGSDEEMVDQVDGDMFSKMAGDAASSFSAENKEENDMLLDTEGEPEPEEDEMNEAAPIDGAHPDLARFAGPIDPVSEDDEWETPIEDFNSEPEVAPEPTVPAITANKTINIGGQQVQIILTGVMITAPELSYIGESVKKAGNKLKAIHGEGNELKIVVEANGKQYTINYLDQPRIKTKTPFSIKKYNFQSLEEALERVNYKQHIKESEVFKKIMKGDISSRSLNNAEGSDIFEGLEESRSHVGTWSIKEVGTLNLKTCINETYRDITKTGGEPNTVVRVEGTNTFYMLKGNLKERSKLGTKKELIDPKTYKSYGTVQVVGIFENTQKGLGEIMYKTRKTSIPLLVWK